MLTENELGTGNYSSARRSESHPWQASETVQCAAETKTDEREKIWGFIRKGTENKTDSITCHYIKCTMCSSGLCNSRRTWQLEKHPGNGNWVGGTLWDETNKARTLLFGEEMAEGDVIRVYRIMTAVPKMYSEWLFIKMHNMRSKDTRYRSGHLHLEISLKELKGSTLQSGQWNSGTCCCGRL